MNIHCLCIVRDEIDVLKHTLEAALEWARIIYVSDNGSTDGTWELLQDYGSRHPKIVLTERELGPYREAVWAEMANEFATEAREDDWWCRLDADEIYIDDPRQVLARVPPREKIVWSASVQYYFTDVDLAAYRRNPRRFTEEWDPSLLRHYSANWSEPRFVRHDPGVDWSGTWPENFYQLRSARRRIRLRHYQYRSPPQIQRRMSLRLRSPEKMFRHEKTKGWLTGGLSQEDLVWPNTTQAEEDLWRTRIVRADALDYDDGESALRIDQKRLPRMWGRPTFIQKAVGRIRRPLVRGHE